MKQTEIKLPEIKIVGIAVRTNNAAEFSGTGAKISLTVKAYADQGAAGKIAHRVEPGTTYSGFTDYESDHNGMYTYFIGERVSSFDDLPKGFSAITIPAQTYAKFTNGPGAMPGVCIAVWQRVWGSSPKDLGGQRGYVADFEIYDERAYDPTSTVLDVYIGIEK